MTQQLHREILDEILLSQDINNFSLDQIGQMLQKDEAISKFAPDGICQVDPRNGDRIVFNSARAWRPHDNQPTKSLVPDSGRSCVICQGQTTKVIDVEDLDEGFTFINENLFPIFYPVNNENDYPIDDGKRVANLEGIPAFGFHFLQWTSSFHDKDWHNMHQADRVVVMQRLAALEKKLLTEADGYVSIIKNFGRLVGGSLAHGHQQISFSNIMPRRARLDQRFEDEHGEAFSKYLLRTNPPELNIRDYGAAVLLVPYFMRRPFDMFLLIKDSRKTHLFDLDEAEIAAVADGWRDAIHIMLTVMPQIGRESAYNLTTHNGPGTGLYFEFLPYTQEMGGFEHLGLFLCQGNPTDTAKHARAILAK